MTKSDRQKSNQPKVPSDDFVEIATLSAAQVWLFVKLKTVFQLSLIEPFLTHLTIGGMSRVYVALKKHQE